MFRLCAALGVTLLLAGCVSTEMRPFVGKPIQEAQITYGAPAQVIDMPDGHRAYQFRYGGGTFVQPGYSTTTATTIGSTLTAQTVGQPGAVISSPGCLITFMARQIGGQWIIDEARVPKGLAC